MPLEVSCRTCGRYYAPSTGDILSGIYRLCPSCRPQPDGEQVERPSIAA